MSGRVLDTVFLSYAQKTLLELTMVDVKDVSPEASRVKGVLSASIIRDTILANIRF
jgi:hypothetical protein